MCVSLSLCPSMSGLTCERVQTDPKSRVALYKLRQTWGQYIANKKLAAIDRHIHALDPAWPVTAVESPSSPTIFVNPNFLRVSNTH